ncbi:stAR-related lipid transfer protein 7, mitochondrial [Macrotis lagotis]|uniref:stAR-related lipid transfer protein 7, mitochondrial n=1 Tax=Macrotis lagotis TaxID=92651 RepID=UPI003D68F7B2
MLRWLRGRPPAGVFPWCRSPARLAAASPGWGQRLSALKGRVRQALGWPRREPERGRGHGHSLLALLANQCSYVTGLRLRRAQQIGQLYGNIYSERTRWSLWSRLWRRLHGRPGHAWKLMAALGGVFVWEEERIQEEELRRSIEEMKRMEEMSSVFRSSGRECHLPELRTQTEEASEKATKEQPWEMVMDKKHFKLWRRLISGTHLYQYRVFGTYTDVTPRQFFNVQVGNFFLNLFLFSFCTNFFYINKIFLFTSKQNTLPRLIIHFIFSHSAVEHPNVPESPEFVRVRSYESQMVIRPHKSFDENGFDYLLTYSDNPQTVFPRYCVSWMVSSGMPDFLEKLHMATLKAKNMEIKVKDYISTKPLDAGSEAKAATQTPERKSEGSCGPPRIEYA